MISKTCKTAIKAVIFLASKEASGEKSGVKEIAQRINASEHSISKVLQSLVRQRIINSIKGPSGGFYITKEQQMQPLINIVDAIDGKDLFIKCGLGLSKCSSAHPCPIHDDYKQGREIIHELFKTKTIHELYMPVESGMAYLIG